MPVDTQSIIDSELTLASGKLDFWMYDWYPVAGYTESQIMNGYLAHKASSKAQNVKFAFLIQDQWMAAPSLITDATWTNLAANAAWLQTQFNDRNYLRTADGRPVLGFFNPTEWNGGGSGSANTKANYFALLSLLEPVYKIGYGIIDTAASGTSGLKLQAITSYDGGLGASLAGTGQNPWSAQVTKDQSLGGQPNFDLAETVTVLNDNRPRKTEAGCAWADPPTIPDQITALQFGLNAKAKWVHTSPWDEIDESGGAMLPTIQDGTRYLDALGWARGLTRPGSYTYNIDAVTSYVTRTGSWTRTTGVTGAYYNDIESSSTANDTIALVCNATVLGSNSATATIEFMCAKDPTYGIADFLVNGASQGTVDLYAVANTQFQSVKTVSVNLGDTVTFKVTGTHGSGSGNTVALDSFRVTYTP